MTMPDVLTEQVLLASDAGRLLGITGAGVRHLIKSGHLTPDSKTPSGYAVFRSSTIDALRVEREQQRKKKKPQTVEIQ